jgi:hypothetical protein
VTNFKPATVSIATMIMRPAIRRFDGSTRGAPVGLGRLLGGGPGGGFERAGGVAVRIRD